MLRLVLLTSLAIVAVAADDATTQPEASQDEAATAKPTPAPPSLKEQFDKSEEFAKRAMSTLESSVADLRRNATTQTRIDAIGYGILSEPGKDKRDVKGTEKGQKELMKSLAAATKSAAADMQKLADDMAQARKAAGANVSQYEPAFKARMAEAKQLEDHARDLDEEADGYIGKIYRQIEHDIKDAEKGVKVQMKEREREREAEEMASVYMEQAKGRLMAAKQAAAAAAQKAAEAAVAAQKEAVAAAEQERVAAAAAAKEVEVRKEAAEQAAAAAAKAMAATPKPTAPTTGPWFLAAMPANKDAMNFSGLAAVVACVGLASVVVAGLHMHWYRPTPNVATFPMLG